MFGFKYNMKLIAWNCFPFPLLVYFFFLILYDPDIVFLVSWTLYQFYTEKGTELDLRLKI